MKFSISRRAINIGGISAMVVQSVGSLSAASLRRSGTGAATRIHIDRGTSSTREAIDVSIEDRTIQRTSISTTGRLRTLPTHVALTEGRLTVDGHHSEVFELPGIGSTSRILHVNRHSAWVFDDARDHLLHFQLKPGQAVQQERSIWLGGQRLQSACVVNNGKMLIGWDNRHAQLIAIDAMHGGLMAKTALHADNVTFA